MRLLEAVHGGQSRVLVVSGDPGVGKTALMESAIASASGFRVVRAVWVWSQRWSWRSRRCSSCARRCWIGWTGFPPRSGTRSGWRSGCVRATRRIGFWSGLAVLSLFSEVAQERPLLCVVDDAQWLDRASAQALVFVARRLLAESVALVLVTREPGEELEGLPRLAVEGLR